MKSVHLNSWILTFALIFASPLAWANEKEDVKNRFHQYLLRSYNSEEHIRFEASGIAFDVINKAGTNSILKNLSMLEDFQEIVKKYKADNPADEQLGFKVKAFAESYEWYLNHYLDERLNSFGPYIVGTSALTFSAFGFAIKSVGESQLFTTAQLEGGVAGLVAGILIGTFILAKDYVSHAKRINDIISFGEGYKDCVFIMTKYSPKL